MFRFLSKFLCSIPVLLVAFVMGGDVISPAAAFSQQFVDEGALLLAMNSESDANREELLDLLAVLEEETEIATKTKMNGDYVPGMVTVLHGDHLEALGVQTVAEALSLVPGIQLARIISGEPSVKVRGLAFPFNAGNIQVMLNSIALSRESSGINSSVLLTPVAQVDRIEVIRGPGSSIYGDFAMAGVVNILTKDSGGRLFAGGGDDESKSGGGHYTYRNKENSFGLGLNVSVTDDGENAAMTGTNPDEERSTGVFTFDYKNFSFTAEGVKRSNDHNRPQSGPLQASGPPQPSDASGQNRLSYTEKSWAMEGSQVFELGKSANLEAHLTYLHNDEDSDDPREFNGDRLKAGLDMKWEPWAAHQLFMSCSYTRSDIDDAFDRGPPGKGPLEISSVDRRNYSLSIQDQVTLSDRLTVTLGARFDNYDDVGEHLTPRLAGVYRLGEHHVVKAQYSEGFRAPTFWELYRTGEVNETLDFETIETTELAYIYRQPKGVGRVTLYYSQIDNGIFGGRGGMFDNSVEIGSKGVEVEWEQQLSQKFRWLANISYNDTSDERYINQTGGDESPGIADWLGNLAIFLQPQPKLMVTVRLLHVGDRNGTDGDVEGYDSVDFTVSRTDFLKKGITLRGGVKNCFDETIVYTTQRAIHLGEDEFRGRTWWLRLSYDF